MPHNRYYLDADFAKGSPVMLEGDEWHHLARVTRCAEGETVELVNGRGLLAVAQVTHLNKRDAELVIEKVHQEELPPPLILAQALPRMNHLEWIIEKGTELGATAFWLFPGHLSEKGEVKPAQMERLKNLTISAMKQCGRLDLPKLVIKGPLAAWDKLSGTLLFGDTDPHAPHLMKMERPMQRPIVLFIGPEKGFSPVERKLLLEGFGAKGVRLHKNILRAETAPLVGLSLLQ